MRCPATQGRRPARSAFSLTELLIVMAIVGVLVALLMPGLSKVRETLHMTQCRTNLYTIYQAYGVWRSDNENRIFNGGSWIGRLLPYVEYDVDTFKCPVRQAMTSGIQAFDYRVVDSDSREGQDLIESNDDWAESFEPPLPSDSAFEFQVWWQEGWDPNNPNHVSGSEVRSDDLAYTFSLDNSHHCRRRDMGDRVLYEVDDEGSTGGAGNPPTYDDIKFMIQYNERGQPVSIQVMTPNSSNTVRQNKYSVDFMVNGEVFIGNWHDRIGETKELKSDDPTEPGSGGGGTRWNPETQQYETYSRPLIVLADYALSVGTYERRDGSLVHTVDPKLFLIMDFAFGRPLVDFNQGGERADDDWDLYFFEDPQEWEEAYPEQAENGWQTYQALRHFGRANVLHCDGHVEALGPEELYYTNPLWVYHGN
jgi:prepilin-type N-terminal cleavage/methylation domain-containing protein/prepilin-type processing-associated H-X9-DG protein